jgi:hypothetical protein
MTTAAVLICEGSCNPSVRAIDRELEQFREHHEPPEVPPWSLCASLRNLRYTLHRMQSTDHAVCTQCGALRRFGGGSL